MANSDFSLLTSNRVKSGLVSDISKDIKCNSSRFPIRERVYIKTLAEKAGNIYWLHDDSYKLTAFALMDSNYIFEVGGIKLKTIGHTIAKKQGYMGRVLKSMLDDHKNQNLIIICRDFVYNALNLNPSEFICLTSLELKERWPGLANLKTDYFNVKNDIFVNGLIRKNLIVSIKKTDSVKAILDKNL